MRTHQPKPDYREAQNLRPSLLEADDHKLRRVLAVIDNASDPALNQVLLDPLRPRLAALKPVRPLRFVRLLFTPLDPVTVSPRAWARGDLAIPRSVMAPIASAIRAEAGDWAREIDQHIAGHTADDTHVITEAGGLLWPRAAEIIARAPPPAEWSETGLKPADWSTLAGNVAAVLRRAPALRDLARDEDIGALALDDDAMNAIARNIAKEPEMARALVARLILMRSPRASRFTRNEVGSVANPQDAAALRDALRRAMDPVLSDMEEDNGFRDTIGQANLADVGDEVRRTTALLRSIETETAFAAHRPRLKMIKASLDTTCRERFSRGVNEGIVAPLSTAQGPVDAPRQMELEACSRDLRKLDLAARPVGGPVPYDRMLHQATEAVRVAAEAGTLTPMRQCRLVEILAGPEAAEALYEKNLARA